MTPGVRFRVFLERNIKIMLLVRRWSRDKQLVIAREIESTRYHRFVAVGLGLETPLLCLDQSTLRRVEIVERAGLKLPVGLARRLPVGLARWIFMILLQTKKLALAQLRQRRQLTVFAPQLTMIVPRETVWMLPTLQRNISGHVTGWMVVLTFLVLKIS